MKAKKDNSYTRNEIWLDTESNQSVGKSIENAYNSYGEIGMEETARFEHEEEDKNDLFRDYLDVVKEDDSSDVEAFLTKNKKEIDPKDRDIYIYILVISDLGKHYQTVNDFFDNHIANLPQEDALFIQELPESFDELKDQEYEREKI